MRLLLVEDDDDTRDLLGELLADEFEVFAAASAEAALELFEEHPPDVVLTDESLPGLSGSELAAEVKRRAPQVRVVLASGYRRREVGATACDAVLEKPITVADVVRALRPTEPSHGNLPGDHGREAP